MQSINALVVAVAVAAVAYLIALAYVRGYVSGIRDALIHLFGVNLDGDSEK